MPLNPSEMAKIGFLLKIAEFLGSPYLGDLSLYKLAL